MIPVYYSPDYTASAYAFDTTRKSRWIAESLATSPIPGIDLVAPEPITREQLLKVHEADYVRSVETGEPRGLASSSGLSWDKGNWPMVCASNGGAVQAAISALTHGVAGSLSSGLHHARRRSGAGLCTFNGLVLAAKAAIAGGAQRVLVLDLDAHCGGGTASLIENDTKIWQLDVSVSQGDYYDNNRRASLWITDGTDYLALIDRRLSQMNRFDLVLYNAGMDPFEDCDLGGCDGITREVLALRERMVFRWAKESRTPIAFVLAGGYIGRDLDEAGLVSLHRLTLNAAVKANSL